MPVINIHTVIAAPLEICFNCSRNIDLHVNSMHHTGEKAVGGRVSGLIELNETVTWKAKHFGIWQYLTTVISEMKVPHFFVDEQVKGAFQSFRHEHIFQQQESGTLMKDIFTYKAPLGLLGKLADILFLKQYMTDLLQRRNGVISEAAENEFQRFLAKQKH